MSIDISMRLHINRDKDKTLYAYARVCVREKKGWFDNDWEPIHGVLRKWKLTLFHTLVASEILNNFNKQ